MIRGRDGNSAAEVICAFLIWPSARSRLTELRKESVMESVRIQMMARNSAWRDLYRAVGDNIPSRSCCSRVCDSALNPTRLEQTSLAKE